MELGREGGRMSEKVIIVNTHPGENPEFVGKLVTFLESLGIEPEIIDGYDGETPLDRNPSCIILSGVPIDADYSLAERDTQRVVDTAFGWLRESGCPVLGICYGHQILAHVFGGEVSSLQDVVTDERMQLTWQAGEGRGIFWGSGELEVFAEHRDYVSRVPREFETLCRVGEIPYIIYHRAREMYGVQFVPEQSDENCRELLEQFVGAKKTRRK
jgi:GMP synthase (glutamine-hydrolysing)